MFARIIIGQLKHKWVINVLLFLTMISLVSLYTFILNTNRFSSRSMQLIMKNMGLNQLVIPESQSASDTYLCTGKQAEFPEDITRQIASHKELMSRYYLSVLQEQMAVSGSVVVLTGIQPVQRPDETQERGNPVKTVKRGTARLGSAAASVFNVEEDDTLEIKGQEFDVVGVIPEQGTLDDCRVFLNLADLQEVLGKKGKINAIQSFECLESGGTLE